MFYSNFNLCCQDADGMACQAVLAVGVVVTALCIDTKNGCVVAGIQDVIKFVYLSAAVQGDR